jgi:hypothetical protein
MEVTNMGDFNLGVTEGEFEIESQKRFELEGLGEETCEGGAGTARHKIIQDSWDCIKHVLFFFFF